VKARRLAEPDRGGLQLKNGGGDAERFAGLDAVCNSRTYRFLEMAGIGPG
jgi:hypothetical protein